MQAMEAAPFPAEQGLSPAVQPFLVDAEYPSWSRMTVEGGVAASRQALAMARESLAAIAAVEPAAATFENTFLAYSRVRTGLRRAQGFMYHLSAVLDSEERRKAGAILAPELAAFQAEQLANARLWAVLKHAAAQPWVQQLSPARQRFVQQTMEQFTDAGVDLPADKKARKAAIEKEISQLTLTYDRNLMDSTKAWQWVVRDKAQLAGMSAAWLEAAALAAQEQGHGEGAWLLTADNISCIVPVLRDCTVEATRKKCWEARCSIGATGEWDNAPVIARIMELRLELARLLGFSTFAELRNHRRMVGSGEAALAFVDEMMQKLKPAFDAECAALLRYVSRCKGEPVSAINPWDTAFYSGKYAAEIYRFDAESLRVYHEEGNVLRGMFAIFSRLLGVSFTELPTICLQPGQTCPEGRVEVWHPDVKLFAVSDTATGARLGSLYMDLYARKGKRAGAWMMPMRIGEPGRDARPRQPHLAAIVADMSAPAADGTTLFSHYDLYTLFHEFGHAMHLMCSDTELQAQGGTAVDSDFVELPSQLFENWIWNPEGIATYAFHYRTGEPMPEKLVQDLCRSRYFMPATQHMSQLSFARIDLEMYLHYPEKFRGQDIDAVSREILKPWSMATTADSPCRLRNLFHCISGPYPAGYYSYKWAEVLSADAFSRFRAEGLLNPATGAALRKAILSQGNSRPATELFRDFMGRNPNPDALLRSQGLLP